MVAVTVTKEKLDDILQCSICTEIYTDPRALPCLHTFCFECIADWCKNKLPGDTVACPMCRNGFVIPSNGLINLQKNFFIGKLLDINELKSAETHSKPCDICVDVQEVNPKSEQLAKVFCLECQQSLCQSCSIFHTKLRSTSSHKLVNLHEISKDVDVYKYQSTFCDKHSSRQVEVYCFECKTTLCMMCYIKDHSSHKCSDLVEVIGDFCSDLKRDIQNMANTISRFNGNLKFVHSRRNQFLEQVKNVETMICQRAEQLQKLIDTEKHRLLDELFEIKASHEKELEHLTRDIEQDKSLLESYEKYCVELLKKGTAVDITREANRLRIRSEELGKEKNMETALNNLSISNVLFTPSSMIYDRSNSILGDVISVGSSGSTCSFRVQQHSQVDSVKLRIVYSASELYALRNKEMRPSDDVLKVLNDHGLFECFPGSLEQGDSQKERGPSTFSPFTAFRPSPSTLDPRSYALRLAVDAARRAGGGRNAYHNKPFFQLQRRDQRFDDDVTK